MQSHIGMIDVVECVTYRESPGPELPDIEALQRHVGGKVLERVRVVNTFLLRAYERR